MRPQACVGRYVPPDSISTSRFTVPAVHPTPWLCPLSASRCTTRGSTRAPIKSTAAHPSPIRASAITGAHTTQQFPCRSPSSVCLSSQLHRYSSIVMQSTCSAQATRDKHPCIQAHNSQHVRFRIQSTTKLDAVGMRGIMPPRPCRHGDSRLEWPYSIPFHSIPFHFQPIPTHPTSFHTVSPRVTSYVASSTALSHSPPIEHGCLPCTYTLNNNLHTTSLGNIAGIQRSTEEEAVRL